MRHEATVAHVLDPLTGELHHAAAALVGHCSGQRPHYHAAASHDSDGDVCAISTALHQAVDTHVAAPTVATNRWLAAPAPRPGLAAIAIVDVYRIAPKTSPPSPS